MSATCTFWMRILAILAGTLAGSALEIHWLTYHLALCKP